MIVWRSTRTRTGSPRRASDRATPQRLTLRPPEEAATVTGMGRLMMFRRMIVPQALRTALPGMGNQWQSVIKESALVSVTGLVETMNQISTASNSTQMPFFFYSVGAVIYLIITTCSDFIFRYVEKVAMRGQQRARL